MKRGHRSIRGVAVVMGVLLSGCYGPFNLTRRLYQWNRQVGTPWEREFMFLLLAATPVYGLTVLGDAVVFNAMEFWTGKNPVDSPVTLRSDLPRTTRIARGNEEALLTYVPTPEGQRLLVQPFRDGKPLGALRIERRDGLTVGADAEGRVVLTAHTLPDGSILIRDGYGTRVASYSSDQVERWCAASARHQ
ncbi:MAG: DUF3332 family protein [Candidatus Omnitrophica bacterium]|nr:DUF3332 family protein [Candidatus Omnitrophota bacterium]